MSWLPRLVWGSGVYLLGMDTEHRAIDSPWGHSTGCRFTPRTLTMLSRGLPHTLPLWLILITGGVLLLVEAREMTTTPLPLCSGELQCGEMAALVA